MDFFKRTWAEIDLDALNWNTEQIRQLLPEGTSMLAVVKADAYGHGDRMISTELENMGIQWFGVSNLEEAISLRDAGIRGEILIFGYTPPSLAGVLAEHRITQAVFNADYAAQLDAAAKKAGVSVLGHLKIDTGMGRIGFACGHPADRLDEIIRSCRYPALQITGIFSHFSSSDDPSEEGIAYTRMQQQRFDAVVEGLRRNGIEIPFRHLQNSAGIVSYSGCRYEAVRAGIILYGHPLDYLPGHAIDLRPVMSLRSTVAMVKTVQPGDCISYSRTFVADREMRIATIPVGYADGYLRAFSNRADVLIRGKRAPVIGNVCMDQLMVDVSHIPEVQVEDLVTLAGRDGKEEITFSELADLAGTIHYELLCLVGKRVPRVYLRHGKVVEVRDLSSLFEEGRE
ncbi:MAG: alanine racemase [Candidatus Merdivicinus sp.]|jgi:alanine racemase